MSSGISLALDFIMIVCSAIFAVGLVSTDFPAATEY
jgi:hypothetical protein